jgi:tRNA1Val (adenine37-N6)-methyltransferase
MSNNYFQFKQFTIQQDKCAMKVCTDACLFGAMVACMPALNPQHAGNITQTLHCLDIGTGTGILSLMFAQKNSTARIDAVEINADAAEQAKQNFTVSPWADRLQVFNEDILTFSPGKQYEYIFANPPFFEDDLQSSNDAANNAKHDTALNLLQLLTFIDSHLSADGYFAVLLPYHRVNYFIKEATNISFHLNRQMLIKQTAKHTFFRGILFFSRKEKQPHCSELIIKDPEQNYTPEFTTALKDYYLYL